MNDHVMNGTTFHVPEIHSQPFSFLYTFSTKPVIKSIRRNNPKTRKAKQAGIPISSFRATDATPSSLSHDARGRLARAVEQPIPHKRRVYALSVAYKTS